MYKHEEREKKKVHVCEGGEGGANTMGFLSDKTVVATHSSSSSLENLKT